MSPMMPREKKEVRLVANKNGGILLVQGISKMQGSALYIQIKVILQLAGSITNLVS
jgi:hypothetical protein